MNVFAHGNRSGDSIGFLAAVTIVALHTVPVLATPVSFTGSFSENFDGLGTDTTMPEGFRTLSTGTGNSVYAAFNPISSAAIAAATESSSQTLTVWTPPDGVVASATSLFNCGTHGLDGDRALGSDPTVVAAMVIELAMRNETGSDLTGVTLSYDVKCLTNGMNGPSPTEAGELPGYSFFYSMSGGTTAAEWTRVNALSVGNFTQDTSSNSGTVTVTFPAPLSDSDVVYFRWADDNSMASGPDQMIAIDNIVVGISTNAPVPEVVRGPYLQLSTPTSIVVRWRTDRPCDSRVIYGPTLANMSFTNVDPAMVTNHEVTLTGLQPDSQYYYAIGTTDLLFAPPDADCYFLTHPLAGTTKAVRIWVIGDAGTGDSNQAAVRNAFYQFNAAHPIHAWLQLGDNVYDSGLDTEYQINMFNVYTNLLRRTVTWPTLGNHDTAQATDFVDTYPYFDIFTLPTAGEAGGVPSGTEHYYSFDLGMVHFACLDSMTADRSSSGAMATWLAADLAATTNRWIIAYFHHPPYTKGSHDSDVDTELLEMRENLNPILEAHGADLVLSGHSHSYERSYLINGHYGVSQTLTANMIVQPGGGRDTNGVGPYIKPDAFIGPPIGSRGTVYSVVGSSGRLGGGPLNHPAHFISLNNLGSMVLDITSNRLDATFLRESGAIDDTFTIIKTNFAPVAQNLIYARGAGLSLKIPIVDLIVKQSGDINRDSRALQSVGVGSQGAVITTNAAYVFYDPANDHPDTFTYTLSDRRGGETSATVEVTVINQGGFSRAITPTNGRVTIDFAGIPGFEYDIQRSTNLIHWTVRNTLVAPPNGLFQFIESNAPSPSYYRLRQH